MKYEIIPNVGAGEVRYGMSRNIVRGILNSKFIAFKKASAVVDSEHYTELGLLSYYDDADKLEALEFARPAEPMLIGIDLLTLDLLQARNFFRAAGGPMHHYDEGPISKVLGLGVWAPDCKESPRAPLESVIAFGPGYYEKYPDEQ